MFSNDHSVHIGAVSFTPGNGGIARVARNTVRALSGRGVRLSLLSLDDREPLRLSGRLVESVKGSRMMFALKCHMAATSNDWHFYDFLGTARAHPRLPGLRRPYCVWIHGVEVWCDLPSERLDILKRASLVIANSHFTRNRFEERHGILENLKVCPLSTEEDTVCEDLAHFAGPPTALIVSRIDVGDFYKGHRELINAWPKVVSKIPNARLVIVGGGNAKEQVETLVAGSSVGDSIEVRGFVSEAALRKLWQDAHVFVMPSRGEGFGLVYVEAMRRGLPIIASIHDAGQEVNIDGRTGYNVDLDRAEELSDRLTTLLSDADLAQQMGKAAARHWFFNYRYSAFQQRFEEVVGSCAE